MGKKKQTEEDNQMKKTCNKTNKETHKKRRENPNEIQEDDQEEEDHQEEEGYQEEEEDCQEEEDDQEEEEEVDQEEEVDKLVSLSNVERTLIIVVVVVKTVSCCTTKCDDVQMYFCKC